MIKVFLGLLFYTLGLLGLFLSDLMINHYFSNADIKDWVLNKSLMMMVGPLLLFGYNSTFLRYPNKIYDNLKVSKYLMMAWFIIALLVDYLLSLRFSMLLIVAFSFSILSTSLLRVVGGNLIAQINQSIWKILLIFFLILIIFFDINDNYYYEVLTVFLIVPSLIIIFIYSSKIPNRGERLVDENHKFAFQMFISSIMLSIATYSELALLATFYSERMVAEYFKYFTVFTAFGIFLSGYLGFYLTPKIRKKPKQTIDFIDRNKILIYFLLLILAFFNLVLGFFYFNWGGLNFDPILALLFLTFGFLKVLYIYPTAKMGALAQSNELKIFLSKNIKLTTIYLLGLSLVVYFRLDLYILVMFVLLNWGLRVFFANSVAENLVIK